MQKAVNGLVARNQRAEEDDQDDEDAGEILGTSVAVGKSRTRLAARETKSDPEGYRGGCVADVMNGIGQKSDAAGGYYGGELQQRSDCQNDE